MTLARRLLAASAGLASIATAQPIETINFALQWDQSVLTSGVATGSVYAFITPELGTNVAWNSLPGKGQPATLLSFGASVIDLLNLQNGLSGGLGWTVPSDVNFANIPGTPDGLGGIKGTTAMYMDGIIPNPNPPNPTKILDLVWDPQGDYSPRTVEYKVSPVTGKVFLSLEANPTTKVGENAVLIGSQSSFQVIPAPAAAFVLAGGGLIAPRRKRP